MKASRRVSFGAELSRGPCSSKVRTTRKVTFISSHWLNKCQNIYLQNHYTLSYTDAEKIFFFLPAGSDWWMRPIVILTPWSLCLCGGRDTKSTTSLLWFCIDSSPARAAAVHGNDIHHRPACFEQRSGEKVWGGSVVVSGCERRAESGEMLWSERDVYIC